MQCDHLKTQFKRKYTRELLKFRGKKSNPKGSIQTNIQNIYSSIPELPKKYYFLTYQEKLNSFDKRISRVIESTDRSLVHMVISGAVFHMCIGHLYSLKLSAASPQETEPAHVPKNRKETKRKNLTDRNSYSLICFHRAYVQKHTSSQEQHRTGHLNCQHCCSARSATKTRPTMCGTLAGDRSNSKTFFLHLGKLQSLTREIINYKAPIIYSKSGFKDS